jgi:hypothetical protein
MNALQMKSRVFLQAPVFLSFLNSLYIGERRRELHPFSALINKICSFIMSLLLITNVLVDNS